MLDWKVGDSIVCVVEEIGDSPHDRYVIAQHPDLVFPKYREIYTIRNIFILPTQLACNPDMPCVLLKELVNKPIILGDGSTGEMSWQSWIFRKVTDIPGILSALKTKSAQLPALIPPTKIPEYIN